MHQGSYSNQTLSGHTYHRFGNITECDVISSRELTNTLKLVRIDDIFTGIEWRSKAISGLAYSDVGFLGGQGGLCLLVSLTAHFSWTVPSFDKEGRPSMAGPGGLVHTIWSGDVLSTDDPRGSIQWQCLWLQIVECLTHCMLSVWFHRGKVWLACHL